MVSMDNAQKRIGLAASPSPARVVVVAAGTTFPSEGGEPLLALHNGAASSADLQLFVRDVRDGLRKSKRPVTVRSWSTIKDVKDAIQNSYGIPSGSQRLFFGPLLTMGGELPNRRTLHDVGIYRSGETLLLDIKRSAWGGGAEAGTPMYSSLYSLSPSSATNDVCISSAMMDLTPKQLRSLVQEARRGLALGFKPVLSLDGSAGTYFLHDTRKQRVAVFKPADEEPYAENNPRGYLQQPGQPMRLRDGVDPGQACIREVAAYLLDHDAFSGVPMTTLAEARHPAFNTNGSRLKVSEGGASIGSHSLSAMASPSSTLSLASLAGGAGSPSTFNDRATKAGSFQEFVKVECTMDDMSPSKLSVDQVHRIAILDIRILNADRNAANLLVRRTWDNELELVPIDHGYCLRSVADVSWMDWCWLDWPQVKQPLSEEHREYIRNLDIDADARMLSESLNICQEAIDYFRASSSLLKAGAKAGLSLYEIACLCCRNDNLAEVPSMLEKLFDMAEELAAAAMENDRWDHTAASRALVEQLSPTRRKRNSSMLSLVANSIPSFRLSQTDEDILELASSAAAAAASSPPSPPPARTPSGLTRALEGHGRDSPALLAQSSASDSSSEAGDNHCDKDLRYEWAAAVIQDVAVDPGVPVVIPATHRRTMRSGSIVTEEDALSSSPKGFWHIRPGTTPVEDDVSVTWSPCASPRTSSIAFSDRSDAPSPLIPLDDAQEIKLAKPTTVTFANLAPGPYLPPQSAIRVSPFKAEANLGDFPFLQRSESGMSRSKSYSALSVVGSASKKSSFSLLDREQDEHPHRRRHNLAAAMKDYGENYDVYRKYFHNFIDLVIVRETSAVRGANSKKQVLSSSAPSPSSFRLGF